MTATQKRVRIERDNDAGQSPRDFDGTNSRMLCWHRRYDLGDSHNYDDGNVIEELALEADTGLAEFADQDDYQIRLNESVNANYVIVPIYMYDHSGIALSAAPFSCLWDSGCVGFMVTSMDDVNEDFNGDRELARKSMLAELEEYAAWVEGDVWHFCCEELVNGEWEYVDGCSGFYGSDFYENGMKDHVYAEYEDAFDVAVAELA